MCSLTSKNLNFLFYVLCANISSLKNYKCSKTYITIVKKEPVFTKLTKVSESKNKNVLLKNNIASFSVNNKYVFNLY